jgi:uncharacterized protein YjbI with pentapeptide repeats
MGKEMTATTLKILGRFNQRKVLFEHTCEDNTMRKTVEAAIDAGIRLCEADLYGADLHGADLSEGSFEYADFYGADLSFADLRGTRLINASLRKAFLYGANLQNTDLFLTDFEDAKWVPDSVETTEETIQKSRYLRSKFARGEE